MQRAAKVLEDVDADLSPVYTVRRGRCLGALLRERGDTRVIAETSIECNENEMVSVGDDFGPVC